MGRWDVGLGAGQGSGNVGCGTGSGARSGKVDWEAGDLVKYEMLSVYQLHMYLEATEQDQI